MEDKEDLEHNPGATNPGEKKGLGLDGANPEQDSEKTIGELPETTEQIYPVEAKEFFLLEVGEIKIQLGSCCVSVLDLINQGWSLFSSIKNPSGKPKGNPSYT